MQCPSCKKETEILLLVNFSEGPKQLCRECKAAKLPPKDPPWDEPCHAFVPGRYFVAMWFLPIPPNEKGYPHGGNIAACLWRYDSTPTEWVFKYRFRIYKDERIHEHEDKMNWYVGKCHGTEEVVERNAVRALELFSGAAGLFFITEPPQPERLEIRGDSNKAIQVIMREKPEWLHPGKIERR